MASAVIVGLIAYGMVVMYLSSLAHRQAQTTADDYFVANRSVRTVMMLGTICLSIWSALAFYGYAAGIYRAGIGYFSGVAGACLVGLYAPTIMYRLWLLGRKYGYVTPGDFMAERYYSSSYRWITALTCLVFIVPYIALQVIGVSNGIEVASGGSVKFWVAAALLTLFMVWHVLWGGARSIAYADTLAGFSGLAILVVTVLFVLYRTFPGGMAQAASSAVAQSPKTLIHHGVYGTAVGVLGLSVTAGMAIVAWPHIFVRSYFARSKEVFKVMAWAFPLLETFTFTWFLIEGAYLAPALYGGALPPKVSDNIVPMMVTQYAPAVFAVLVVVGVFAFGMSTADSQLLVSSSVLQVDIYDKMRPGAPQAERVKFAKLWVLVMMAAVLWVVAARPTVLVDYAYKFSSPGFAQLMPSLIGGLYWRRATREGALTGTVLGLVAVLVTLFFKNPVPLVHPVLWGLAFNMVAYVLVSLATPAPPQEVVERIHGYLDEVIWREAN